MAAVATPILLAPAIAWGDKDQGEQTPLNLGADAADKSAAGDAGDGFLRTIIALVIVIAVIYGVYWVLKQVRRSREAKASGTGLESVASVPLGGDRSMHLVRAGTEFVLVGVGEKGVVPIRTYTEDEAERAGLTLGAATDAIDGTSTEVKSLAPPRPGFGNALVHNLKTMTVRR